MYAENRECMMYFYDYVGMARDKTDFDKKFNTYPPETDKSSEEILNDLVRQATEFREKELEFAEKYGTQGYGLQLLEQAVITMIPLASKYYRKKPDELFISGFGVAGIHYFKRRW